MSAKLLTVLQRTLRDGRAKVGKQLLKCDTEMISISNRAYRNF
jgi:hypothetical protein